MVTNTVHMEEITAYVFGNHYGRIDVRSLCICVLMVQSCNEMNTE